MGFFRRKRFEDDMDAELRFHIEAYAEDLIRSGVEREEARRRARIEFGSLEANKEECRQAWGLQHLDDLRADLRLALRGARQNPGFAAIGILSLALGIGANTAIFSLIDATMLRALPVRDPARLVFVEMHGDGGRDGPPYPYFELLRRQNRSFEDVAAFGPADMELQADQGREMVRGVWVSDSFYALLGAHAVLGRALSASSPSVVISRAYWQKRFGGDPAVIGRTLLLANHTVSIAGVMPTELMSLERGVPAEIAAPMALSDAALRQDRSALWLFVVGRLKPGILPAQARAESDSAFQRFIADVPMTDRTRRQLFQRIELGPAGGGLNGLRRQFAAPLTALMLMAGLVLLAACINMTNLMLARATARQRDFAVRLAIGASRGRLIRQTLTEALLLTSAGAALGLVFAQSGQAALAGFFAEAHYAVVLDLSLNWTVLLFTLGIGLLGGVVLGLAPAMRSAWIDPAVGLQGRGVAGSRLSVALGRYLVLGQVALSIVLLAGAGLFVRSLSELKSVDLGFRREGVLTMEITPERHLFGTTQWLNLQTAVLDQLRRLPGVSSAAWTTANPLSGRARGAVIEVPGFIPRADRDSQVHMSAISPDYFATLSVPMLLGRAFNERDSASARKVAMMNQSAARFYFPALSPIGQKIRFTNYQSRDLVYEVVGVVRDMKHEGLREPAGRFVYLPLSQYVEPVKRLALSVRTAGDPADFIHRVRQEIQGARPALMITDVSTMENQIDRVLFRERIVAALSTTFGGVTLMLAGIGLYGILAYAVTRRTNEIGIRRALGATSSSVVWLVFREALVLTAAGVVLAVPVVWGLGRVARTLLFGTEVLDPLALAAAILLPAVFTAIAAIIPGYRATRLDPTTALRID